ncbi:hypothetical protein AGMMS4956_06730 [Bacteroidia bacterium]|nr:hypothetical protein AGMMS4956_06730 [Bacteroidia bacterium]
MQKILSILLLAGMLCPLSVAAQEIEWGSEERKFPQGAFFVDLFGESLTYSINYDQRFFRKSGGLGAKVGVGYFGIGSNSSGVKIVTIPITVNYLAGKRGNYFEMGLGMNIHNANWGFVNGKNKSAFSTVGTVNLGYRRQPADGGFLFRGYLSPLFQPGGSGFFWPLWVGISFGYAF